MEMGLRDEREALGVLGELVSHITQIIELKDCRLATSLAMRYLAVMVGNILEEFCRLRYGRVGECAERASEDFGSDVGAQIDELLRVREVLLHGGDEVSDAALQRLLTSMANLYVSLERALIKP
jgi:hypothetical protein